MVMRRIRTDSASGDLVQLADRPGSRGQRTPRLGEVLIGMELVQRDDVGRALKRQRSDTRRLGELLVDQGLLTERDVATALAKQARVPAIDLRKQPIDDVGVSALREADARRLRAVVVARREGVWFVAVDAIGAGTAEELRGLLGGPVRLGLSTPTDIDWALESKYRATAGIEEHVEAFQAGTVRDTAEGDGGISDDAPMARIVRQIVTQAVRDGASDVHLEPQDGSVRVRFRVDGALQEVLRLPGSTSAALVSRIKVLASMNIVERRRPQDGQLTVDIDDRGVDIRVSTLPTLWGEKVVLRLLDKTRTHYKLQDLGMPDDTYAQVRAFVQSPFGMVICAGPTGTGKTTTLYASLLEIDTEELNVTTIEDPVEVVLPAITQININEQSGLTFARGLRTILRQDPDVILVGEIRDAETARIAVQSALTGHAVLSSLHATDAAAALQRFLDMGLESYLVASSVVGVIGQRLVRRICDHCKEESVPTPEEAAFYADSGGEPPRVAWSGAGCHVCAHTGYRGRVGVFETLRVTDAVKSLVLRNAPHNELRSCAMSEGMRPLRLGGLALVDEGITTISEVMRKIYTL